MATRFEWHPLHLFEKRNLKHEKASEFALVIINRPIQAGRIFSSLWKNARVKVAADGGANRLFDLLHSSARDALGEDVRLDAIVGDLDSVRPSVQTYFTELKEPAKVAHNPDQDSYDLDKTVSWIRLNSVSDIDIVIHGSLDGRIDHGLRLIHYLYLFQPGPEYTNGKVFLVSSQSLTILLQPGIHRVWVHEDDDDIIGVIVGLIPVANSTVIRTKGLEKDFEQVEMEFGSLMGRRRIARETAIVEIETSNPVLFTVDLSDVKQTGES